MSFKLGIIRKQHNKLRAIESLQRLIQVSTLAHAKKLLHAAASFFEWIKPLRFKQNGPRPPAQAVKQNPCKRSPRALAVRKAASLAP